MKSQHNQLARTAEAKIISPADLAIPNAPKCPRMPHLAQTFSEKSPALTEKQTLAIRLLVTGTSLRSIREELSIDRKTLFRWRKEPRFAKAVKRLRRQLWNEALDRLRSLVHPSLDELEKQLREADERTRYRSANAVLRHANLKKCAPI